MSKGKYTVSWIMADEPLLKLKEPDETYDIAGNVFKFIQENKLHEKEDFKVEVEIDKNKGENGVITSLKEIGRSSSEAPKEEKSNPKSEDLVVKELTVNGVSVDKKAVKFKEDKDNDTWYTLDDSINAQDFKDKYTRKTVEISVKHADQGNDIITSFIVKEDTPSDKSSKNNVKTQEPRKINGNMMQKSIEAQASVNSANRVAQAMITKDTKPDDVKKIIRKVAEFNFELIQEFKNKE